jgi:hypothetical protein
VDKVSFPNIKQEEKNISLNNTFQNSTKKNSEKTEEEEILVEINEEEKHIGRESLNSNYYITTGFTNEKQMKKAHSLYEYNDAFKNMKLDVFNQKNKSTKASIEKINYDNLLKYSSFYNNIQKNIFQSVFSSGSLLVSSLNSISFSKAALCAIYFCVNLFNEHKFIIKTSL